MVDAWGGWQLFQELLRALDRIARKYGVSIANVAARYILDMPAVAGAIVGVRLSISEHIASNKRIFDLGLTTDDLEEIHQVTERAKNLYNLIGDCGGEYRR
jgi:aryl-alcohol dehydrogenase-like predicted oxidoreductase